MKYLKKTLEGLGWEQNDGSWRARSKPVLIMFSLMYFMISCFSVKRIDASGRYYFFFPLAFAGTFGAGG